MAHKDERERQERLQRMLAREQGQPAAAPPARPGPPTPGTARRALHRAANPDLPRRPAPEKPEAAPRAASADRALPANARPLSPILRRRKRRRRLALAAVVLALVLVAAVLSGAVGEAWQMAADAVDSAVLYMNRGGGGWPADTGIQAPLHAVPLAGGAVVVDSEDVAIYSAYGTLVRTIQPGYARPSLAVGNTRFALYNRSGTELRIESRTATLDTKTFPEGILLCAMSPNGSVAVVTQSDRYAAVLEVLDPDRNSVITYSLAQNDGVPVVLAFAKDNQRFACGGVAARGGQMQSLVYIMDTRQAALGPCYTADAGSLILALHWLGGDRVLAVLDTYAALLNAGTGAELARYDYGGAVLQNAAVAGYQPALLLTGRSGSTLVTLGDRLQVLAQVDAGPATGLTATADALYLMTDDAVLCYGYNGALQGRQAFAAGPQAVLAADQPLVLAGGVLQPFAADP